MAKNVFRPAEVVSLTNKVMIQIPQKQQQAEKTVQQPIVRKEDVYDGPSADDLRREAEEFKAGFVKERETLLAAARAEADSIVREAESRAFEEIRKKTDEAASIRKTAEEEASRLLEETRIKTADVQADLAKRVEETEKNAYKEGYARGRGDGYRDGQDEVKRLVERLHVILSKSIEKRDEILREAETQLINLVLLIAKKVIKVISENQKSVVINNAVQALRKLKTRTDVVIRVNTADLKMTSQHIEDFIRLVENAKTITVMEDTSVDPGGCIIETDFGLVDARISSQLNEIEDKILELMPIRSTAKPDKAGVAT